MRVNAGELNKRIGIYAVHAEQDTDGYVTEKKSLVRSCWAKVSQSSITELRKANADMAEVQLRFLIRWSKTPIDRKMRVCYDGRDYEIKYINPYGDSKEYVEILCNLLTTEATV